MAALRDGKRSGRGHDESVEADAGARRMVAVGVLGKLYDENG